MVSQKNGMALRWIAAVSTVLATNFLTASIAHNYGTIDKEEIRVIVGASIEDRFTTISQTMGMYAIEGRPRIKSLEDKQADVMAELRVISRKLDQLSMRLDP